MGYLDLDGLQYLWGKLKEKFAAKSHTHDERYYTEGEVDTKLGAKLSLSGGTMTGPIGFKGSNALPHRSSLNSIAGFDPYSNGGTLVYSNSSEVKVGAATKADSATTASSVNGITPEWSGSLGWGDTNWIAAWTADGKKIKALAKSSFSPSGHTHTAGNITLDNSTNFAGYAGPIEAAHIDVLRANRLAFLPASGVTVEYSTDGGSTWVDYGATDAQKAGLFAMKLGTGSAAFYTGKHTATADCTSKDQLRITVSPVDRYCSVNMLYLWVGIAGTPATVDIARSTIGAKTTFSNVRTDVPISGWNGPNEIRFNSGTFGGATSQTSNSYSYRFTFKNKADAKGYICVYDIRMYGPSAWSIPNNMVMNDHMYSWDNNKNVTFPASVTASTFNGNLDWSKVTNKPSTYTPSSHTHTKSQITDFPTSMPASDVKAWAKADTKPSYAWGEITSKPALMESGDFSSETIEALLKKVQGQSPRMGSVNLTKDTHVANTWWNFIYTPHRTGSGADNGDFGTLLLFPMTGGGSSYIIRASKNATVAEVRKIYTSGDKPTKADVGLSNVDNTADANKSVKYAASAPWSGITDKPSTFTPSSHTHDDRYYTESEMNTKLAGKADSGHTHGLKSSSLATSVSDATTNSWDMVGGNSGFLLNSLRTQKNAPAFLENNFAAGIVFGGQDTKGVISTAYNAPGIKIAGGNGLAPVWWLRLTGTSGKEYNLDSMPYAQSAGAIAWDKVSDKPSAFPPASHTHSYLPLSGGAVTGRITRKAGGMWIEGRDNAVVFGTRSTKDNYSPVVGQKTLNGAWTIGNLGGNESLVFNYESDSNYNAGTNSTSHVYLPAQDGTIITSATIGNQSVAKATNSTNATNVTQTASDSTYTNWRPFIIGASGNATEGTAPTTQTGALYAAHSISAQPSTGTIRATTFKGKATAASTADMAKTTYIDISKTVDLTNLDQNTWYPVVGTRMSGIKFDRISCMVSLDSGSKPSWSTHSSGFTAIVEILDTGCSWGVNSRCGIVLQNDQIHIADKSNPPVGYNQMTNSSAPVFYLRGGANYFLHAGYDCAWSVKTEAYTVNSQTVSPVTTYPGINIWRSTIVANLNGNASTASTATTATTATKLSSSAGSATQPVYFSNGVPVATTYSLNKTVPADAKFTDTNTWRGVQNNLTSTATDQSLSAAQGKVLKDLVDGKAAASHTHTKSQITDFPTSLKNPTSLTIQTNGTTAATYDGSAAKTVNITKSSIGLENVDNTADANKSVKYATSAGSAPFLSKNTTFNKTGQAGIQYYDAEIKSATSVSTDGWGSPTEAWYQIIHMPLSVSGYFNDIAIPVNDVNGIAYRQRRSNKYYGWYRLLDSNNWKTYVTKGALGLDKVANTADADKSVKSATTATQLSTSAGSATQPVYFSGGKPVACTYTLGKSVPADAKFTDTTYGVATTSANGLMSSDDKKKMDSFSTVISIDKSLKVTTDWMDTGIAGANLDTGTYIIQMFCNYNNGGFYNEYWSGVMSWFGSPTNSGNSEEIFLHNAGHADNANELYLRTCRTTGGQAANVLKLQIAAKTVFAEASTITFKFRRLI